MELAAYLKMFPPRCADDLYEAFLFGAADNGEYLRTIGFLRSQEFTSHDIVVCLTAGVE